MNGALGNSKLTFTVRLSTGTASIIPTSPDFRWNTLPSSMARPSFPAMRVRL